MGRALPRLAVGSARVLNRGISVGATRCLGRSHAGLYLEGVGTRKQKDRVGHKSHLSGARNRGLAHRASPATRQCSFRAGMGDREPSADHHTDRHSRAAKQGRYESLCLPCRARLPQGAQRRWLVIAGMYEKPQSVHARWSWARSTSLRVASRVWRAMDGAPRIQGVRFMSTMGGRSM